IGIYVTLYLLAIVLIMFRHAIPGALGAAYGLCAIANGLVAVMAGADAAHFAEMRAHEAGETTTHPLSLDDHQPAVGLGGPITRTLWTLIWGVSAMIFQMFGITYMLGGKITMPLFMRDMIDTIAGPTTFFVGATLAFFAAIRFRRVVANGLFAWSMVN